MQRFIGSANIIDFGFDVSVNIAERKFIFDLAGLTTFETGGAAAVLGICFSVVDSSGLALLSYNWGSPQIPAPIAADDTYELDLSNWFYDFLFQQYSIKGAIKDQDGTIYELVFPIKDVCKPLKFTDAGYAEATFLIQAQCNAQTITVKDATVYTYSKVTPDTLTKTGVLYYPQGTISPVNFSGTPFRNPKLYTGSYTIQCTSNATYDLGDGFFVIVQYYVRGEKTIYCGKSVSTVFCCINEIQERARLNCGNPVGLAAQQQLLEIAIPLMQACAGEIIGVDVSAQVELIKKTLKCTCGRGETIQVEQEPQDLGITSIVIEGAGGTSVGDPTVNGETKTYTVISNNYVVQKGDVDDLAFEIETNTDTQYTTKYILTFDYAKIAEYIYNATADDDTLLTQLNSLIFNSVFDLSNINGKCVIDLSSVNYFLSLKVASFASTVKNIVIGTTTYNAPANLLVNNTAGIDAWLNGLALGDFESSYSSGPTGSYVNVLTVGNQNTVVSMTFTNSSGDVTVLFQKTNKSVIALFQAIIDYLCEITAAQVYLGRNLDLCYYDYNGELVTVSLLEGQTQDLLNQYVVTALCGISNKIQDLTALTCAKIQGVFAEYPNAIPNAGTSRYLMIIDGNCTQATPEQAALGVIAAIQASVTAKAAFCAIDCSEPATCPDVAEFSAAIPASGEIGIYDVSWSATPSASQTVTVKYRLNGDTVWIVSTNALLVFPSGNISGNVPYVISGLTPGLTYDVQLINNCGGTGFIKQVTVPSGLVYSNDYLVDSALYNLCGNEPITLYSSQPFGTGVTMYTDSGFTTPLTGEDFIALASNGIIYEISNSTGIVGDLTGNTCGSGVVGDFRLDNSTVTICAAPLVHLYTNGAFGVSKVVYVDSALTTPQTGYSYVLEIATGKIYNLNSSTGVVGADTSLTCVATDPLLNISNTTAIDNAQITRVRVAGVDITGASFPVDQGDTTSGETNSTGTQTIIVTAKSYGPDQIINVTGSNGVGQCMNISGSGATSYTFTNVVLNTTTPVEIEVTDGPCPS